MKKKIYFIASAILQIIFAFYCIINAGAINQAQIDAIPEAYASYPVEYQENILQMTSNSGELIIFITSILAIVLNIFVIKWGINNALLKNKGKLIAISLTTLLLSNISITMYISLINLIVLVFLKRKNPEDFPTKEKRELPVIEYKDATRKEKIFGIIFAVLFILQFLLEYIVPENTPRVVNIGIIVAYYIITFVLGIICFKDKLKNDIKLFHNEKAYSQYILPRLGIMYIIYILASVGCVLISQKAQSDNQSMIEAMPLWVSFILAIFWAPVVEELVFRGVLRRFIKNNTIFIISSAIIFGLLHTFTEATVLNVIVLAIPYAILGGFFAYIYSKTNNIFASVLVHAFHNTLALLISTLVAFIIV